MIGTAPCAALLWLWDPDWRKLTLNLYASNVTSDEAPPELLGAAVQCPGGMPNCISEDGHHIVLANQPAIRAWAIRNRFADHEQIIPVIAASPEDPQTQILAFIQLLSGTEISNEAIRKARELGGGMGALLARSRDDRQLKLLKGMLRNRDNKTETWLRLAAQTLKEIASAEACIVFRQSRGGELDAVSIDPPGVSLKTLRANPNSVIRLVAETTKIARVADFANIEERQRVFKTTSHDARLLERIVKDVLNAPLKSVLIGPVVFEEHSIAVIVLLNKKSAAHLAQVFSPTDEAVLATACGFLGGILPSLELYDAVGRVATKVFPGALSDEVDSQNVSRVLTEMIPAIVGAALVRRKSGGAEQRVEPLGGGEEWLAEWAARASSSGMRIRAIPQDVTANSTTEKRYGLKTDVSGLERPCALALGLSRGHLTQYEQQLLSFFLKELSHVLRAEHALEEVNEDFVQVRHAINTGLTGVVGYVHEALGCYELYARMDFAPTVLSQARFGKALKRANFAAAKTRFLLEESRYLVGQIVSTSLRLGRSSISSLVREVVESLRPIAEARNLEIYYNNEVAQAVDRVTMDRLLVEMMIFNVVDNAIKYSYRRDPIEIRLSISKGNWQLEVTDYGVHVKPEDIDKIFRPFVRRPSLHSETRPGTGLGLAVAKSVAVAHDGSIDVASSLTTQDMARTTFTIRLPREHKA